MIFLQSTLLFFASISQNSLESPYNSVKEIMPFNDFGWYYAQDLMEQLIKEQKIKTVIELGSWMGKSTRHIASLLPEGGKVYAVDHWLGAEEHKTERPDYCPDMPELIPTLYEQFLSNAIHAKLTHKIVPIRMSTIEACEKFKQSQVTPDLVYVDASHDEKSVYEDLKAYFPLVQGHGIICGDDWGWGEKEGFPVRRAVERFAKENNLAIELYSDNWVWLLRSKKS